MDDAKTEALTPAQRAEIEENKRPFLHKFADLVYEAQERLKHGTSLTQTFVDALAALYEESRKMGEQPSSRPKTIAKEGAGNG